MFPPQRFTAAASVWTLAASLSSFPAAAQVRTQAEAVAPVRFPATGLVALGGGKVYSLSGQLTANSFSLNSGVPRVILSRGLIPSNGNQAVAAAAQAVRAVPISAEATVIPGQALPLRAVLQNVAAAEQLTAPSLLRRQPQDEGGAKQPGGAKAALAALGARLDAQSLAEAFDRTRRGTLAASDGNLAGDSSGPVIIIPKKKGIIQVGPEEFPVAAFPSEGADFERDLVRANSMSLGADIDAYEWNLPEDTDSIIQRSKKGHRFRIILEYSTVFPHKLSPAAHGAVHHERDPQVQKLIDNRSANLELWVIKGFGRFIAINHNKFRRYRLPGAIPAMLQSGSANYTKTFRNHFENYGFTLDQARSALFDRYFEWMLSMARPFSEDLDPENPAVDFNTIPKDAKASLNYHGLAVPMVSFSPRGGTLEWLVQITKRLQQSLDIWMFAPFPVAKYEAEMLAALEKGIPIRHISDYQQSLRAVARIKRLVKKGLQARLLSGPHQKLPLPRRKRPNIHEKMHEKGMLWDAGMSDGLVKFLDSLNGPSSNALDHNFEATQLWQGDYVPIARDHFNNLWSKAYEPDWDEFERTAAVLQTQGFMDQAGLQEPQGLVLPWDYSDEAP